jgi:hypothetical protein
MSDETPVQTEEIKEPEKWYVLAGIRGKVLKPEYVKEQFEAKKVTIRGAYSTEEIVKYFQNGMITYDTILFKEGDTEWKPFDRQNLVKVESFSEKIVEKARLAGANKERVTTFVDRAIDFSYKNRIKLLLVIAAASMAYFAFDYYYYKPEQIYDRIKQGVVLIATENNAGRTTSLGSGFVVGSEGVIATNLHVISRASAIKIKSGGGLSYDAEGVINIDQINDLALLKIRKREKKDAIDSIRIGQPQDLKVGEKIYVVGNPAGLEFSLSEGIVSGKRSEDPISKEARELLQITAPLSPGNSGGPVLNKKGEVVAVATLASRNDLQNLNFAVPVNLIGDPKKSDDLAYKFLPRQAKWTPLNANISYGGQSGGGSDMVISNGITAYFNQETVVRHGDKLRAWIKVQFLAPAMTTYPYRSQQSGEVVGLAEIDCKKNIFRFNILIGQVGNEEASAKGDFSGSNKWKPVEYEERPIIEKICGKN